jgi:uncharacterized membrane protein YhaH (DUF805 family)
VANSRTPSRISLLLWLFFGLKGRISRSVYWLAYLGLICVNSIFLGQIIGGEEASYNRLAVALGPFIVLAALYANIAVSMKRLHDFDWNGLFALALLVPIVNLAFTIWVGVVPGTPGANAYGAAPDRPPP